MQIHVFLCAFVISLIASPDSKEELLPLEHMDLFHLDYA
ncbi:exported hypothetical protein [Vibrio crassostreae]|nr:exported hypothetical protein [Vibrio crassostreae]